jgi:hypothetical protein
VAPLVPTRAGTIMNKEKMLALSVLIFLVLFMSKPTFAQTVISSCQDISSDGTYVLDSDLAIPETSPPSSVTCLTFDSPNIVLDCQGHRIYGNGNDGNTVIQDTPSASNSTIENCVFDGTASGIFFQFSSLYMYNSTMSRMWSDSLAIGLYASVGNSMVLDNVNFSTNILFPIWFLTPSNDMDCNANLTDVYDSDTGLPIGFYNSSVNVSNKSFGELMLCGLPSGNFDNITVMMRPARKWTTFDIDPIGEWGTTLMSLYSNFSMTNSNLANIYGITFYDSSSVDVNMTDVNVTNFRYGYFASYEYPKRQNCGGYHFSDDYINGFPLIYHSGSEAHISDVISPQIILCNASNSIIDDSYSSVVDVWYSGNVSIDRLYAYGWFGALTFRNSSNYLVTDSKLIADWGAIYSPDRNTFNGVVNGSMISSYLNVPFLPVIMNGGTRKPPLFYGNIISSPSSSSPYANSGSFILWDNGTIGNYYTDIAGDGYSDTCADANHDGICDSPFSVTGYNDNGTDSYPLSVRPLLSLPQSCDEGSYECSGSDLDYCYLGNLQFSSSCRYGCSSGSCRGPPLSSQFPLLVLTPLIISAALVLSLVRKVVTGDVSGISDIIWYAVLIVLVAALLGILAVTIG